MRILKKSIVLFTLIDVILVPVLSFTSCDKNRTYDEAQVKAAAVDLLEKSKMLNYVIFGEGIPASSVGGNQEGAYAEADFMFLHSNGFSTIAELEAKIREVYTGGYSEYVINTVLSPITVDGVMISNARYYQKYSDEINKTDPICIMVNKSYNYIFTDTVEYDYSTVYVKNVAKSVLYVSVMATVTNKDGQSQTTELVFELIEEDGGWRINTNTFMNYNAYLDEYESIKDKPIK